jgi:hypothetical protein
MRISTNLENRREVVQDCIDRMLRYPEYLQELKALNAKYHINVKHTAGGRIYPDVLKDKLKNDIT